MSRISDKPREVRGYLYRDRSRSWEPETNLALLLETDDEHVIWETDPESVRAILNVRYPSPTSDTSYFTEMNGGFRPTKQLLYTGESLERACELAKEFSEISWRNSWRYRREGSTPNGYIIKGETLRYDPERVKRIKRERRHRELTSPMKIQYIGSFTFEMHSLIRKATGASLIQEKGSSRRAFCVDAVTAVSLFNAVFGKNAHRQLESFRIMKKEWLKAPQTKKVYSADHPKFCEWMNKEAGLPNPRKRKLKASVTKEKIYGSS